MTIARSTRSELSYIRQLVEAGWNGGLELIAPAAIGASLGVIGATYDKKRTSAARLTVAALIGTAVGLGAAAVWAPRGSAGNTLRKINAVRDIHWLEKHPIAYG